MFQESELINLCVSLITLVIVVSAIRKQELPGVALFYAGFCCIFAATVFTVLEGMVWNELFNTLEHFCYALGGVSFAAGCLKIAVKQIKRQGKDVQ